MSDYYAPEESSRLRFNVEIASGEYWGWHYADKELRGQSETNIPRLRSHFTRQVKNDPLLLWKVAEWWFKDGKARETL